MYKTVVASVAALALCAGAAQARDIPTNFEECSALGELARTVLAAEKPKPEKQAEIDALLAQLDQHCAASQFDQAQTTAETVIAKVTEGD